MFRPSGTHQYNPKFPKIPSKLNEFKSMVYNHIIIYTEYDNSNAFFRNPENYETKTQQYRECIGIVVFCIRDYISRIRIRSSLMEFLETSDCTD